VGDLAAVSLFRLRHELRSHIWLVPSLTLVAFLGLALGMIAIDRANDYALVSPSVVGSPTSVQHVLSTAASALLSLATVVVSLTLVAVQVAMGQFSPRIVRSILEDRRNQLSIGVFLGTAAYALAVLREIDDRSGTVPGLSVLVAYALIVVSIVVLVLFVNLVAQGLRVSGLIDLVGDTTHAELARLPPLRVDEPDDGVLVAPRSGNIVAVDTPTLVELARKADCWLELVPAMGGFVARGAPLLRVHGRLDRPARAVSCVFIEGERTHEDDPAYGLRKLVDITLRSIASSPFDDPTTASQALHRLHDCVRLLATRELPSGRYRDAGGALRLVMPALTWDGYVRLAFDEVRLAGAGSPQVARRLRAALEDIRTIAPQQRWPALDRQLELLTAAVKRAYEDPEDVQAALVPDPLGIGSGPDVLNRNGRTDGSDGSDGRTAATADGAGAAR
jgi:uncharacterized membrane protein